MQGGMEGLNSSLPTQGGMEGLNSSLPMQGDLEGLNKSLPTQGGLEGLFFELLQVAIGNRKSLTRQLSDDEWVSLYSECEKHALLGVAFAGVERLPKEQCPPFDVLAEWVHDAQVAKERNELLNKRCCEVCEILDRDGFNSCILKGQSNLANYPEYLKDYRTAGDIDVLCWPKKGKGIRKVVEYAKSIAKSKGVLDKIEVRYHHVDVPMLDDVPVEVHLRPMLLSNPFFNSRLQIIFAYYGDSTTCFEGFNIPTNIFNSIYQLVHIYHHLFEEGVGLRQLLDYYFVLCSLFMEQRKHANYTSSMAMFEDGFEKKVMSKEQIQYQLKRLHLDRLAAAVMYVLQTVFDMPDEYLILEPDKKEGEFLLSEIMLAGNFGKYDKRKGDLLNESPLHKFVRKSHNSIRLVAHYPHEALWEPIFRLYHWFWRKFELWRW